MGHLSLLWIFWPELDSWGNYKKKKLIILMDNQKYTHIPSMTGYGDFTRFVTSLEEDAELQLMEATPGLNWDPHDLARRRRDKRQSRGYGKYQLPYSRPSHIYEPAGTVKTKSLKSLDEALAGKSSFKPYEVGTPRKLFTRRSFKGKLPRDDRIPWTDISGPAMHRLTPARKIKVPVKNLQLDDLKWRDKSIDVASLSTVAQLYGPFNLIPQGPGNEERLAYRAIIEKLQLSGAFRCIGRADNNPDAHMNVIRLMVVLDKQPNGAPFPIGFLLKNFSTTFSLRELCYTKRLTVLYNSRFPVSLPICFNSNTNTVTSTSKTYIVDWFKKKHIVTAYTGTGALINDISTNAIWIVAFREHDGSNGCDISMNLKIRTRNKG